MKVVIEEDISQVWVTADHHFRHANIIKYCDRPFANLQAMDAALIANWNAIVRPQDQVIHLGDFTLRDGKVAREYLAQLNGDICVLSYPWHHDRRWLETYWSQKSKGGWEVKLWPPMVVLEIPQLGKDERPLAITLCHYPLAVWDRKHHGAWHLHGHSHGNYKGEGYILDVGVDVQNFHPINLGGVLEAMYERGWC